MNIMKQLNKAAEIIEKVADLFEGAPNTFYLDRDPVLLNKIKAAVTRYSKLPPESTAWWNGATPDFLRFQTEIWPKEDDDVVLFMTVISRAVEDYFLRQGKIPSIILIPDPGSKGQVLIQGYFGTSPKQNRKLAAWYTKLTTGERQRALEKILDLRDEKLEQELEEVKEIDMRILAKQDLEKETDERLAEKAGEDRQRFDQGGLKNGTDQD